MKLLRPSLLLGALSLGVAAFAADTRPNILFIVADDLNHWVGYLHRNPQTRTPNLDRLAAMGVNFTHAYCASSVCNASRSALMSGKRTATIGVYGNGYMPWSNYIDEAQCLNGFLKANGYYTAGAGKIYHEGGAGVHTEGTQWDKYVVGFGKGGGDDDVEEEGGGRRHRPTNGAEARNAPVRKNAMRIGEFEIGQLDVPDSETEDYKIAEWGAQQLGKTYDKPFFLALGLHKPHLPWVVPKKYFDMFPLDQIQLPPHTADDLDDLPPAALKWAHTARWNLVMADGGEKAWKQVVQAYLASVAYMDAQVGIILDALEKSPHAKDTIIIFFGDHGWHLGEKERFGKSTVWEEAARAPLIWSVPGLTPKGVECVRTIDFLSFYPTLCELTGLPKPAFLEGVSIKSLLADPKAEWKRPALTTYGFNNHGVRSEDYRYIRYANGDEELYDERADPYEWKNLAKDPKLAAVKAELAKSMPTENKPAADREAVQEERAKKRAAKGQ